MYEYMSSLREREGASKKGLYEEHTLPPGLYMV